MSRKKGKELPANWKDHYRVILLQDEIIMALKELMRGATGKL